ncbi:MAG: retropepsin-like domain-containing protein [Lachnospiraceae bacterium]|nr:retropepsin-like domain-containing protein [Lachnospiraceae bacterium]
MMNKSFSFPLGFGLEKTGLPLVITSGKLKNLCFLIDTGSTHNVLFDFVYEHFKDEFRLLENTNSLFGIEGNKQEVFTVEATFCIGEQDFTSVFSVMNASKAIAQVQEETGVQIHGILGIPFLMENEWILDFNKCMIYHENS